MSNFFKEFKTLINPDNKKTVGKVVTHNNDGSFTVLTVDNSTVILNGVVISVGKNCYIENNVIIGEAPTMALFDVTV
ncbi:MAG: hypothetical protein KAH77_11270 [Thiomargarita sp.]|nr:hypothetical protein [Thiomargarita sp.]